jgi:hypothetical protein
MTNMELSESPHFMNHYMASMTNMELSESPHFMNHYMASLFLPHTDMGLFPTVEKKLPEKSLK